MENFLIKAINAAATAVVENPTLVASEKVLEILNAEYLNHYLEWIKGDANKKSQVWELEDALRAIGQKETNLNIIRKAAIDKKSEQENL